jgi:hypothetical protein
MTGTEQRRGCVDRAVSTIGTVVTDENRGVVHLLLLVVFESIVSPLQ